MSRGQASVAPSDGDDPIDELVSALRTRALAGDVAAAREYRLALAVQAERAAAPPAYDVRRDPDWIEIRTTMLKTLERYPEARQAVADALG